MLRPSIFHDSLFDDFFDFPFYDDKAARKAEKKLYGHHVHDLMKTDIKEKKDGYELIIDLPGFHKDQVSAELTNGYLVISAAKGMDQESSDKASERYSEENVLQDPAREATMSAKIFLKKILKPNLSTAF